MAVDTAKRVFQLHWVDMENGEIVDLKLTRAKFLEHFANRTPCMVAMEACGGSQHWARQLRESASVFDGRATGRDRGPPRMRRARAGAGRLP